MGHTMEDWHRELAGMVHGAYELHAHREQLPAAVRADAVTIWRHTAHVLNLYASDGTDTTWAVWWADAMSRDRFLELIERRSQARQVAPARMFAWEWELANYIVRGQLNLNAARGFGQVEAIRRLSLELDVCFSIAAAYTRCSVARLHSALWECGNEAPPYGTGESETDHPLLRLIAMNRPVH